VLNSLPAEQSQYVLRNFRALKRSDRYWLLSLSTTYPSSSWDDFIDQARDMVRALGNGAVNSAYVVLLTGTTRQQMQGIQ